MTLTTFLCEWNILPDSLTRNNCLIMFGGMTQLDDLKELGEVNLLGRWSCVGEARGYCIAQAKSVEQLQKWLMNWVTMADIKVTPCLDDNQHRELILEQEPSYKVSYDNINDPPKENESIYAVKYNFKEGCQEKGFEVFANLSEEDDKKDSGNCTSYGRWHVPSKGSGFAVASCPSAFDIYKWAHNWNSLCDVEVIPVTRDEETRNIIKTDPNYETKKRMLMDSMDTDKKKTNTFCCI